MQLFAQFIETWLLPIIGQGVMALAVLLLGAAAFWVAALQARWFVERTKPDRITLGTINLNGTASAECGHLILESWDRYFSRDLGDLPNMGLVELPALDIDDKLTGMTASLDSLEIEVNVAGVNVKQLVATTRMLAQAPNWTLESDIHAQKNRQAMKLYLRRRSRTMDSWHVERSGKLEPPLGADGKINTVVLSPLVDDAVIELAYDRYLEHNRGTCSGDSFPNGAAFAAFVKARHHFRRYGELRGNENSENEYISSHASDVTEAHRHLQKATHFFRAACASMPDSHHMTILLGVCLAESRNEAEAVDVFDHAVDLLKTRQAKEEDAYESYVKARLLRESARGKQYTVSDLHEAVNELEKLADEIKEAFASKPALNKQTRQALNEDLAHVYIQLAHNHGRYLALMRHNHIRDMFENDTAPDTQRISDARRPPAELRIDELDLSDLALVTSRTFRQCQYILDSETDPQRKEILGTQLSRLLPEREIVQAAKEILRRILDFDEALDPLWSFVESKDVESEALDLDSMLADYEGRRKTLAAAIEVPPDVVLDYARLEQLTSAAQEAFAKIEGAPNCPGCKEIQEALDKLKEILAKGHSPTSPLSTEDLRTGLEAVVVFLKNSTRYPDSHEGMREAGRRFAAQGGLQWRESVLQQVKQMEQSLENAKAPGTWTFKSAKGCWQELAGAREALRSTPYSTTFERQMRADWPSTKLIRNVYRALYKTVRDAQRRDEAADEALQEILRAAESAVSFDASGWENAAKTLSHVPRPVASRAEEDLLPILPNSKAVVAAGNELKVVLSEEQTGALDKLIGESHSDERLSLQQAVAWAKMVSAIGQSELSADTEEHLSKLQEHLAPNVDQVRTFLRTRRKERESREQAAAKSNGFEPAKKDAISHLARLNGLLTSTEQQTVVRRHVRKLWDRHHHWLEQADKIKREFGPSWNTQKNAYRQQNLDFQQALAVGYTNYRLAAWLDDSWTEIETNELFPLGRDSNPDSPAGHTPSSRSDVKTKIKTFQKHCDEALASLRRANGAGPDRYHVQQYLGLVYGDPRFDPDGRRSKLARQHLQRSIQLDPNSYYSHEQLAILLRRDVNRIGVVEFAREWLKDGILEADKSARLRPIGASHVYRVELRAMLNELDVPPGESDFENLDEQIDLIWSQAQQFSQSKVEIRDPGLRWVELMRAVRVHAEPARKLLSLDQPRDEPAAEDVTDADSVSKPEAATAANDQEKAAEAAAEVKTDGQTGAQGQNPTEEKEPQEEKPQEERALEKKAAPNADLKKTVQANGKIDPKTWRKKAQDLHEELGVLIRDCHILEHVWVVQDFVYEVKQRRMAAERLEQAIESTQFDQPEAKDTTQLMMAWGAIDPIDRWRFSSGAAPKSRVD